MGNAGEAQAALVLERVEDLRMKERQKKAIEEARAVTPASGDSCETKHSTLLASTTTTTSQPQDTARFDLQR